MKVSVGIVRGVLSVVALGVGGAAVAQTLPPAMPTALSGREPAAVVAQPATPTEGTAPAQPTVAAQPAQPAVAAQPAAATGDAPTGVRSFRGHPEDDLLREMATRPVRRVIERFNSSTLVFHCDLGDGVEIAFKPARRGEHDWWRHEVAGYELARALGMQGRVPPAVYRRVPVSALDGFLRDADLEVDRDGTVEGAAIFWMPVLRRTNLHTPEARAQWSPWMDPRHEIPAEHRRRATQIAALVAFDYLQANFDRWNSANVPQDERDDLVFRDNNRGWYLENLVRMDRGGIDGLGRVPASLVPALARATDDVLARRTLRVAHRRMLNPRQLAAYELRRRALLARLDELVREHGRERVLLDDADDPIFLVDGVAPAATGAASPVAAPEGERRRHSRRHHRRHRDDADGERPRGRHRSRHRSRH